MGKNSKVHLFASLEEHDLYFAERHKWSKHLPGLSEAQNHRCCYCHEETWREEKPRHLSRGKKATVEHVIARCDGGTHDRDNLVMACESCNRRRGHLKTVDAITYWELSQDQAKMASHIREMRRLTQGVRDARTKRKEASRAERIARKEGRNTEDKT